MGDIDNTFPTFVPQARAILDRLAQLPIDSHAQEIVSRYQREMHQLLMAEGYLLEELRAAAAYVEADLEAQNLQLAREQITDAARAAQETRSAKFDSWMATQSRIEAERYPADVKVTEVTIESLKLRRDAA